VNLPPRGIGATAMRAIESAAGGERASLYDGLGSALESGTLPTRAAASARSFREIVEGLRGRLAGTNPGDLLRDLTLEIGYEVYLRKADEGEADSRLENVDQLITAAKETVAGEGLQAFLDRASLVSETESVQGDAGVKLMTLHSAKGLEFGAVFLVGVEEGLLPHLRTLDDEEEIEEERRLCYVGMTRAAKRLQMTAAAWRRIRGESAKTRLSRFVAEIDEEQLVRERPASGHGRPASRSWPVREDVALGEEDVSDHPDDGDGENGIRVGVRVKHEAFGVGEVLGVEPARGGQKLTVRFRGGRTRTLLAPPARLTPVRHSG
jgi:DNA helicase-2/ATP-dependent DNA helicase PcrA